jgi:hypothetical protein
MDDTDRKACVLVLLDPAERYEFTALFEQPRVT